MEQKPAEKAKLPLNIRNVKSTGKFYVEFGKGRTLLLGPQRQTVEEALADKEYILGEYILCPRRLGRHPSDLEKAKQRAQEICKHFRENELGIQERLGAYYVTHTVGSITKTAVRFTRDDAVAARQQMIDNEEVPWRPPELSLFQFIHRAALHDRLHFPLFVAACGPRETGSPELTGRTEDMRQLLPMSHSWLNCQDCCVEHLDENGSFQRCPWKKTTTIQSVRSRIVDALAAVHAKNMQGLPVLIYLQSKVFWWLFRHAVQDTGPLWQLLCSTGSVIIGPHFSRLGHMHVQELCNLQIGFCNATAKKFVQCRSKRQQENMFGSPAQTELSRERMGSAGFRQCPENIFKRARKS